MKGKQRIQNIENNQYPEFQEKSKKLRTHEPNKEKLC